MFTYALDYGGGYRPQSRKLSSFVMEALNLPRGLALAPQRLARARPIAGSPFGERHPDRLAVHPRHHQDFAGVVLLGDCRHQPVGAEPDLAQRALDRVGHVVLLET